MTRKPAPIMTYAEMIALNDKRALYEVRYADTGTATGIGEQDELVALIADDIFRVPASDLRFVRVA